MVAGTGGTGRGVDVGGKGHAIHAKSGTREQGELYNEGFPLQAEVEDGRMATNGKEGKEQAQDDDDADSASKTAARGGLEE